jgi:hypothetical protein
MKRTTITWLVKVGMLLSFGGLLRLLFWLGVLTFHPPILQ